MCCRRSGATTCRAPPGRLSDYIKLYLNPQTVINDVEGFRRLVVHRGADSVIRLGDVARIEMGAESYDQSTSDQGRHAVLRGRQFRAHGKSARSGPEIVN